MSNSIRGNFQAHPFHLVSPSPWPLYTSISLLTVTTSGVLGMHGFSNAIYFLVLALITLIYSMSFWFRDIISEGTPKNSLKIKFYNNNNRFKIVKAISNEEIKKIKDNFISNINLDKSQLGHYLAGLLEGDGDISLPFLGNTVLNRVLNPRIIFTSHVNDIGLYVYIQSQLGGIGRFQIDSGNRIRYIIGDVKGIITFINIVHNKLRTPKNISFNHLIEFLNKKYNLLIPKSNLDLSNLLSNSWFAGITEANGYFGVKVVRSKSKSCTRKRSVSYNISIKFVLAQRLLDKKTSLSMFTIMEKISKALLSNLTSYKSVSNNMLCVNISAINKLDLFIKYFNKYPLLGVKSKNFIDWEKVYYMFISKEHLTTTGRAKIEHIVSNMNNKRTLEKKYSLFLKSKISYLMLFILICIILLNLDPFFLTLNYNSLILMANDPNTIKGTIEASNVKIENLDIAVDKIRDGAIYIGGMTATAKVVKGYWLPIGAKLGSIVGIGTASLISYKMVKNNLGNKSEGFNIKADNLNTAITGSKSNNTDIIKKFI